MKLELKHIAPYLPFGLPWQLTVKQTPWLASHKRIVNTPQILTDHTGGFSVVKDLVNDYDPDKVKPILTPLSSFKNVSFTWIMSELDISKFQANDLIKLANEEISLECRYNFGSGIISISGENFCQAWRFLSTKACNRER